MSSHIHLQWKDASAAGRFGTGVSLHSHTLHSRESLEFIYRAAAQAPVLSAAIRQGERRCHKAHGTRLDLSRGWWTPPLGAHDAWLVEKSQIEALGKHAIVSITDHDDIEAPASLRVLEECRGTPISVEWTVPYGPTFFHLGVHNLPAGTARAIWHEIGAYRRSPCEPALHGLLGMLSALPPVLIVFNHPLWDEKRIGQAEHRAAARDFLCKFGTHLHALELNGLRPWNENRDVAALGRALGKPLISGGDRHALEPNALLNFTNAGSFDEFVEEVREGWSDVFVLRQYQDSYALRIVHNMVDVLRTYERHANGSRLWSDRVFYLCDDGCARSLTELFGERTPAPVRLFVGAMRFAAVPRVRRFLSDTFAGAGEVTL